MASRSRSGNGRERLAFAPADRTTQPALGLTVPWPEEVPEDQAQYWQEHHRNYPN